MAPPARRRASRTRRLATAAFAGTCIAACAGITPLRRDPAPESPQVAEFSEPREWLPLFNGRDLTDWEPKFTGYPAGYNLNDTFRAESAMLKVRYDRWTKFDGEFGHLFFRLRPFSHYIIAIEYRFVGEQVSTANPQLAWAARNSGIMIHSEPPDSMGLGQDFPLSLEVQLLGGLSDGRERPTANLCTTGAQVVVGGRVITRHCIRSSSKTFDGDQWVRVEALVLGDSLIRHIVNGDTVLTYTDAQRSDDSTRTVSPAGKPLAFGYIALQAETAPMDVRKVELLNLSGCLDPKALTYRKYFVHSDTTACFYASPTKPAKATRPR